MSQVSKHISDTLLKDFMEGILPQETEEKIADHIFTCITCEESYLRISQEELGDFTSDISYQQFREQSQKHFEEKKSDKKTVVIRILNKPWLMAAAVVALIGLVGILYWVPDDKTPTEIARNSTLKLVGIGPTAGGKTSGWIVEYSKNQPTWEVILSDLGPDIQLLMNAGTQTGALKDSNAVKIIVYGSALMKIEKDPSDLFQLVIAHSPNQIYSSTASFFQGLYWVQEGQTKKGIEFWNTIKDNPHLSPTFKDKIREIESAAALSEEEY